MEENVLSLLKSTEYYLSTSSCLHNIHSMKGEGLTTALVAWIPVLTAHGSCGLKCVTLDTYDHR